MFAGKQQAQGPAQQQDQVQAQQAAQGPEHIDRGLAVAQGGEGQAGAADDGQHHQHHQRQACALQPVEQGGAQAVTFGQPQCAVLNARRQIAAVAAGQAIGFLVFQGPACSSRRRTVSVSQSVCRGVSAVTRHPVVSVSLEHNRWPAPLVFSSP